jgi:hypothetical protein
MSGAALVGGADDFREVTEANEAVRDPDRLFALRRG